MTRFISIALGTLLGFGACGSVSPSAEGEPCSLEGSCADAGAEISLGINASGVAGRVGESATIPFVIAGADGLDSEIRVTALGLPVGVTVVDAVLPAGTSEGELAVSISANALAGISHSIVIEASAGPETVTGSVDLFIVGRAGTADVTFGEVGRVSLTRPVGLATGSAVVASDESIFIGGTIGEERLVVWKLTALGDPDPSFGTDGLAEVSFADLEMPVLGGGQLVIQGDGAIVVSGHGIAARGSARDALLVARFTSTGALDPSFGDGGRISQTFGSRGFSTRAVALGPDDSLNIAGCPVVNGIASGRGIVRLSRDGELDGSFGSGGLFVQATGSLACLENIEVRDDGSIIASNRDEVVSIGANGSPDVFFGADGVSTTGTIASGFGQAVDGAIFVGGTDLVDIFVVGRPTMTRLAADGTIDASFGDGGTLSPVAGNGRIELVHPGTDGILVVIRFDIFGDAAVARLQPSGELDGLFADSGLIRFPSSGATLTSVELAGSRLLVVTSTSIFRIWR